MGKWDDEKMRNEKWMRPLCISNGRRLLMSASFLICHFSFVTSHLGWVPLVSIPAGAQSLTFVELNTENMFDTRHDSLKQDMEYLPEATRHWTKKRYWRKLNNIGQELLACCDDGIPDIVALCEVENDTVMHDLTRRSLLRQAGYDYVMTSSPDLRGIDVALLYSPFSFAPVTVQRIPVATVGDMRPTRDILYVAGRIVTDDTLHVFVVHAPSRYGGERLSRPYRLQVAAALCQTVDSILLLSPQASVIVAGDFNDEPTSPVLEQIYRHQLHNVTAMACGQHGAQGTYRYQGDWSRIDHVLVSTPMLDKVASAAINDAPFLTEDESRYGGRRPRRTYNGYRYQPGYSDHLPLIVRFRFDKGGGLNPR